MVTGFVADYASELELSTMILYPPVLRPVSDLILSPHLRRSPPPLSSFLSLLCSRCSMPC